MAREKKQPGIGDKEIPDEIDGGRSDFEEESLLSFIEVSEEQPAEEPDTPPEAPKPPAPREPATPGEPERPSLEPGPEPERRGLTVDEVLAHTPPHEEEIPGIRTGITVLDETGQSTSETEVKPSPDERTDVEQAPGAEDQAETQESGSKSHFLEIHSPKTADERWSVDASGAEERDTRIRESQVKPLEFTPEEKVAVDQDLLSKLDAKLKDELESIREKALGGVIPGEFLEARKRLEEEGILECPRCKIKVPDTPGKIDYCPQCGMGIDDYLGQFKRDWETKYKHQKSAGIKAFAPETAKRERTKWEQWKEDKGVDPEAELLVCPKCGETVYDDPFVANKCPKCNIPLDLHLHFPRDYVRKREAETKGRRWDALKLELDKEKLKNKRKK